MVLSFVAKIVPKSELSEGISYPKPFMGTY